MTNPGPSVLFVNIPSRPLPEIENAIHGEGLFDSFQDDVTMPMGILYLASYLRKYAPVSRVGLADYALRIAQGRTFGSVERYIDAALEELDFTPEIVGFTLNFTPAQPFFDLCLERFRRRFPHAKILAGGNHATNTFRYQLQNPNLDAVCVGEGEIPLATLIKQVVTGASEPIQGFVRRNSLDIGQRAELVQDLDSVPLPAWDLLDMEAYVTGAAKWEIGVTDETRVACIVASRGCPFHCTFCSTQTIHGYKMRFRSVESVAAEVWELHEKFGISVVMPWDDIFTIGRPRTVALLRGLRALGIPGFQIQFQNGLSVNALDREVIDELILTGMRMTALAVESGSKWVQHHMIEKQCNLDRAREHVAYLQEKGVYVRCLFILGFCGETREMMQETIDYAISLSADWCVFSIASPLVGSKMYTQFVAAGIIADDPSFWGNSSFGHRGFDTPEISADDLNELAYRANLNCNFIRNPNLTQGRYDRAAMLYRDIIAKFSFHVVAWYCLLKCEEGLGRAREAAEVCRHIAELVETNPLSREMFLKYRDLMPDLDLAPSLAGAQ